MKTILQQIHIPHIHYTINMSLYSYQYHPKNIRSLSSLELVRVLWRIQWVMIHLPDYLPYRAEPLQDLIDRYPDYRDVKVEMQRPEKRQVLYRKEGGCFFGRRF